MKKFLIGLLFQVLLFPIIVAQSYTWTGGTSSIPGVGSNWSGGTAPNMTDGYIINNLIIGIGTYYPIFIVDITVGNETEGFSGSVTVSPGASAQFTKDLFIDPTYGILTLQSNGSSGDGKIICDAPYESLPTANVQLYLTGGSSLFHYFVPPVTTMTLWRTFGSELLQTRTALLTGNYFNGDLVYYKEPSAVTSRDDGWQWYDGYNSTSLFRVITPTKGYNIYLTGDHLITFKGSLNCLEQTFYLSYTSGNADPGWNLIGNPFPCNYDLSGISALMTDNDDINNYVYYNSNGGYVYWNPKDGTGSSVCTDIIPPMQGFFVHALSSGKSVTLPISSKTFSTAQSRMKGVGSSAKSVATKKIKLVLNSPSQSDETMVGIFDDATLDFNQNHDANKMFNTEPSPYIYSEINGVDYFMKSISAPSSQPIEVPLKVVLTESGSNTIKITEFDNMEAYKITLKHGDIQVPLTAGTIYNFNSNPGTYSDYSLVFNSILTGVDNPNETLLKTWYRNNYLYINYPSDFKAGNSEINIYDFNGRKVFGNKNLDITPGETKQIQVSLQKGFYLTEIITGLKQYKSKIVVY